MLLENRLRELLPALPQISIHGPWWRVVGLHLLQGPPPGAPPGSAPQALWPGGAALLGARFTPRSSFGTIYLASDQQTALMEVRAVVQTSSGPPIPLPSQPWAILSVDGVLTDMLDLTNTIIQDEIGTTLSELTGDWRVTQSFGGTPPTQLLGRAAYYTSVVVGFQYISAENPQTGRGIAVFTDRLVAGRPSYLQVVDPHGALGQRLP